jgi:hypothetical protein
MDATTSNARLVGRIDQAAKGRWDSWFISLGRRHPISWGLLRGTGFVVYSLPKKGILAGRGVYRGWLDSTRETVTLDLSGGTVTTRPGPTVRGPNAAPLATVSNINTKTKQAKQPQQAATAPAKGSSIMAQATTELNKHTAGKSFALMATAINMFEAGTKYPHVTLLEFLDDAHTGFDRVAAGLNEYADQVFAIGVHANVMADLFGAVDDAEAVMEAIGDTRRRVLALYADIIEQETSNVGTINADSTRGGEAHGINGIAQSGKEIAAYYTQAQFDKGSEASTILADLRAAQRGYAAAKTSFAEVAAGLVKSGFHPQVRDRIYRIGDEATQTATSLRRTGRTLMHLYAPQLRHESKTTPHLRAV